MVQTLIDCFAGLRSILCSGRLAAALALGVGLWAGPAAAHIELQVPAARYSADMQKDPPCGHPDNPPGAGPVATYQAGETITVQFEETVNHSGHFRIALDTTGTDTFTLPTGFEDFYNSPEVLLDDIPDMAGGVYMVDVTLPDTPCDPCTLQLIQVMNDGAWGPGDSDLYFNCADITIEGAAADTGAGTGGGDGTGGSGGDGTGGDVGGDVGSGAGSEGGSEGGSSGVGGSEGSGGGGTADGASTGSSGSDGSEDDKGGCSCRADAGGSMPATAVPWLLVALFARRRRSRRPSHMAGIARRGYTRRHE